MNKKQERVDSLLVRRGLARSRQQAQEMISRELVHYKKNRITKPSQLLPSDTTELEVMPHDLQNYVSRAALKLKGAVEHLNLNIEQFSVLDIGISTGGFTDYLLKSKVSAVVGIDVGHDQLSSSLKTDSRLTLIEKYNARQLSRSDLKARGCATEFDLIVVDVSFISLEYILPRCVELLKKGGILLALVKPQFEVGPNALGKGGIVREPKYYPIVEEKLRAICKSLDLTIKDYFESQIEGADGNKEFFIYAISN